MDVIHWKQKNGHFGLKWPLFKIKGRVISTLGNYITYYCCPWFHLIEIMVILIEITAILRNHSGPFGHTGRTISTLVHGSSIFARFGKLRLSSSGGSMQTYKRYLTLSSNSDRLTGATNPLFFIEFHKHNFKKPMGQVSLYKFESTPGGG